jgi:hypothetical protein
LATLVQLLISFLRRGRFSFCTRLSSHNLQGAWFLPYEATISTAYRVPSPSNVLFDPISPQRLLWVPAVLGQGSGEHWRASTEPKFERGRPAQRFWVLTPATLRSTPFGELQLFPRPSHPSDEPRSAHSPFQNLCFDLDGTPKPWSDKPLADHRPPACSTQTLVAREPTFSLPNFRLSHHNLVRSRDLSFPPTRHSKPQPWKAQRTSIPSSPTR